MRGDMILPDGMPVVWTSRLAGTPLPERVAGVDLMAGSSRPARSHRLSVYFLGARKEVVAELVRRCATDSPRADRGRVPRRLLRARRAREASSPRSGSVPRICSSSACRAPSRRRGASGIARR